jgi:hypothetical protein
MEVVGSPGPWMARSIERWQLQAPYEVNLPDAAWEQYYKERAALDWHHKAALVCWYWALGGVHFDAALVLHYCCFGTRAMIGLHAAVLCCFDFNLWCSLVPRRPWCCSEAAVLLTCPASMVLCLPLPWHSSGTALVLLQVLLWYCFRFSLVLWMQQGGILLAGPVACFLALCCWLVQCCRCCAGGWYSAVGAVLMVAAVAHLTCWPLM